MLCTRGQVSTRKGEALWALKGPQDAGRSRETGPVSYLSHQAWAPCLRDGQVGQGPGAPPAWVSQKPAPWVVSGHPRPRWEGRRQEPHLSQHLFARSLGWSCPRKGHQGAWPVAQAATHVRCAVHARGRMPLEAGCLPPAGSDSPRGKQCFWAFHEKQQPHPSHNSCPSHPCLPFRSR